MQKQKVIAIFLLVIMTVSLLGGCGKQNTDSQDNSNKTETTQKTKVDQGKQGKEEVVLKFANYGPLEKALIPFWEKIEKEYKEVAPNVKIEWITAPYGELVQQVTVMAASGDKPDLMFHDRPALDSFLSSGFLAPIDSYIDKKILDDLYDNVKLDLSDNEGEHMYAFPFYMSPYVLYYNKDLFQQAGLDPDKPPKTYEEAFEYANKISQLKDSEGNNVYGLGQATASVPVSGTSLLALLYSFGGDIYDEEGNVCVNTPENKKAFEYLKELHKKQMNLENAKLKDLRNLFAIGRLGMYFDQGWGPAGVLAINPDMKPNILSAPPLGTDKTEGLSPLEAAILFVFKDTGKEAEAGKLIEFITNKENTEYYFTNIGPAFSPRKSQAELEAVVNNTMLVGASSGVSQVKSRRKHLENNNMLLEICSAAQAVTVGDEEVDAALERLEAKLKELLK